MALNPASTALLGMTILGVSSLAAMVGQFDEALGQTVTPPTEVLIDKDPITVPPPNFPVIRRPTPPTTLPSRVSPSVPSSASVATPTNTTSNSPSTNGFSNGGFSADNAPSPVNPALNATSITPKPITSIPITTPDTTGTNAPSNTGTNTAPNIPQPVVISEPSSYSPTNGRVTNRNPNLVNNRRNTPAVTAITTVAAASDPMSLPQNVPVPNGDSETPTDVNQLFAFLSQNIPPVDGTPDELNYAVVLPGTADSLLAQIQDIVPTAKIVSSRMGSCIQVQAYRERGKAESLTAMLRSVGFDARVLHQRGG